MRHSKARGYLDTMLQTGELDEASVRDLATVDREGLYVEFKDGAETKTPDKCAATIRQVVSSFANADGGLLVIGIRDKKEADGRRPFTATEKMGRQRLDEWARSVLTSMASWLVPPPRFQQLTIDGVNVLLIATARAPGLVPCTVNGEIRYFIRFEDSSPEMPAYLASDLVLGRRAHPVLEVSFKHGGCNEVSTDLQDAAFGFHLENVGLVATGVVNVGLVSWAYDPTGLNTPYKNKGTPPNRQLLTFVSPSQVTQKFSGTVPVLRHLTGKAHTHGLQPFESCAVPGVADLFMPRVVAPGVPVRTALYVLASGHPPDWYQFDFVAVPPLKSITETRLTRAIGERPKIAWDEEWR